MITAFASRNRRAPRVHIQAPSRNPKVILRGHCLNLMHYDNADIRERDRSDLGDNSINWCARCVDYYLKEHP